MRIVLHGGEADGKEYDIEDNIFEVCLPVERKGSYVLLYYIRVGFTNVFKFRYR